MRVFRVSHPNMGKAWCAFRTPDEVADGELNDAEPGDKIHIEVVEMSREELEALPEFEGW